MVKRGQNVIDSWNQRIIGQERLFYLLCCLVSSALTSIISVFQFDCCTSGKSDTVYSLSFFSCSSKTVQKLPHCFEVLWEGDAVSIQLQCGLKIQMKCLNCVTCFFSLCQDNKWCFNLFLRKESEKENAFPYLWKTVGTQLITKCLHVVVPAFTSSNYHLLT